MASLFERLNEGRPQQVREATEPQRKVIDLVSQWKRTADARAFLMKILAGGPLPTTVIEDRGTRRGFNMRQLRRAKEQASIVAFKEKGGMAGPWYWTITQHTPKPAGGEKPSDYYTRHLRSISRMFGYRLQPIGARPRPAENEDDRQDARQKMS